jgi:hypothetical protein
MKNTENKVRITDEAMKILRRETTEKMDGPSQTKFVSTAIIEKANGQSKK